MVTDKQVKMYRKLIGTGLKVRVHSVVVPLKRRTPGRESRELVTEIWLQESSLRVSAKPIGPEGMLEQGR